MATLVSHRTRASARPLEELHPTQLVDFHTGDDADRGDPRLATSAPGADSVTRRRGALPRSVPQNAYGRREFRHRRGWRRRRTGDAVSHVPSRSLRATRVTPAFLASFRCAANDGQRAAWGRKELQSPRATQRSPPTLRLLRDCGEGVDVLDGAGGDDLLSVRAFLITFAPGKQSRRRARSPPRRRHPLSTEASTTVFTSSTLLLRTARTTKSARMSWPRDPSPRDGSPP